MSPVCGIFKDILGDEQEEDKAIEDREDGQESLIEEENKDTNKTKIMMANLVGEDILYDKLYSAMCLSKVLQGSFRSLFFGLWILGLSVSKVFLAFSATWVHLVQ